MSWQKKLKNRFGMCHRNAVDSLLQPLRCGLIGLDIGGGSVKLVALQKQQNGWSATAAAWSPIEAAQDQTIRQENTTRSIRDCFAKAGGAVSHYAVCNLSGQEVVVRGFCFPPIPDESLDQAVQLEAQQVSALDIAHSVVDYQLVEEEPSEIGIKRIQRKGYMVIGLEDAINQKIRMAQAAQVRPILIDVNSLATLNCLCELDPSLNHETFAVLDVGYTHSYVVILGADGIPFVRDLGCSSQQILNTISQRSHQTMAQVRQILSDNRLGKEAAFEAELKNACGKLVADVLDTLRFYTLQQNTDKVTRIYLSGGLASAQPFVRLMTHVMSIPVKIFDLSEKLQCTPGQETEKILKQYGPAMTVAVGLAMRTGE